MKILVTGANGFIGKNLTLRLSEIDGVEVVKFLRNDPIDKLDDEIRRVDMVFHLAGVNRSPIEYDFNENNVNLTNQLCNSLEKHIRKIPIIFTSSIQAGLSNQYGISKLACEKLLERTALKTGLPLIIYRLQGVFGKWARPNYNSVVATFCHNVANELPIQISDINKEINIAYIDDVLDQFLRDIVDIRPGIYKKNIEKNYSVTVGDLAKKIKFYNNSRRNLLVDRVGSDLCRALYSTYISYLPTYKFAYDIPVHIDNRGVFVEMIKTIDSGQISFFTAHPMIKRGGHYHHSKIEKFLVIKGQAKFGFRNMNDNSTFSIEVSDRNLKIVETIPGWTHDITNIGDEEMIVMLWSNEIFNIDHPDTVAAKV